MLLSSSMLSTVNLTIPPLSSLGTGEKTVVLENGGNKRVIYNQRKYILELKIRGGIRGEAVNTVNEGPVLGGGGGLYYLLHIIRIQDTYPI